MLEVVTEITEVVNKPETFQFIPELGGGVLPSFAFLVPPTKKIRKESQANFQNYNEYFFHLGTSA